MLIKLRLILFFKGTNCIHAYFIIALQRAHNILTVKSYTATSTAEDNSLMLLFTFSYFSLKTVFVRISISRLDM